MTEQIRTQQDKCLNYLFGEAVKKRSFELLDKKKFKLLCKTLSKTQT